MSVTVGSRVPLALGALVSAWLGHARRRPLGSWQIYIASFIMGLGIGLAFASMANLIVESVPPSRPASPPA